MVAITLGTGVGGGAVLGGKLYTGYNYAGLEVGHFVVEYNGRPCTCGRRGCFETYASATALIKRTREEMERHPESLLWQVSGGDLARVEGRSAFAAAEQGDSVAQALVKEYQSYLACGIASLINIFQPEVFCVGGGVAGAGEKLLGPVRDIVAREDYARHNAAAPGWSWPSWATTRGSSARPCCPCFGKTPGAADAEAGKRQKAEICLKGISPLFCCGARCSEDVLQDKTENG